VNWSADEVPDVPLGVVTVTSTVPAACAGATTVMLVELATTTLVPAVPPKLTVAPLTKLVPVTVTDVPPPIAPEVGAMLVTVGVER
jgi:hypothetical protein